MTQLPLPPCSPGDVIRYERSFFNLYPAWGLVEEVDLPGHNAIVQEFETDRQRIIPWGWITQVNVPAERSGRR